MRLHADRSRRSHELTRHAVPSQAHHILAAGATWKMPRRRSGRERPVKCKSSCRRGVIILTRSIHDATSVKSHCIITQHRGIPVAGSSHTDTFFQGLESAATILYLAEDNVELPILQEPRSEIPTLFSSVHRCDRATLLPSIAMRHHESAEAVPRLTPPSSTRFRPVSRTN